MEQQPLVVDGVSEGTVLHSTMDGKDMLNTKWRTERTVKVEFVMVCVCVKEINYSQMTLANKGTNLSWQFRM